MVVNLGGSLLFVVFMLGALVGIVRTWKLAVAEGARQRVLLIYLMIAAFVYPLLVGQAAPYVPTRFRAPGEFVVAIFFAVALMSRLDRPRAGSRASRGARA